MTQVCRKVTTDTIDQQVTLQRRMADKKAGPFELQVDWIRTYGGGNDTPASGRIETTCCVAALAGRGEFTGSGPQRCCRIIWPWAENFYSIHGISIGSVHLRFC
jgi:hypothetical protein